MNQNRQKCLVISAMCAGLLLGANPLTQAACTGGPDLFTCLSEADFLAKNAELGYFSYPEGFEDNAVWGAVRSTLTATYSAPSVVSQEITWTANFPQNEITTGGGARLTGDYGIFDPDHGSATGSTAQCDVDNPPEACLWYDGFTATRVAGTGALYAAGGYIKGTVGSNLVAVLDGDTVNPIGLGKLADTSHHFFGVVNTAGFSSIQFKEIDGKVGQKFLIFGDDFTFALDYVDSDGDGVTDALDSAPLDATNSGAVIALPIDSVDPAEHGHRWGDRAYYSVLAATFQSDGADKVLHLQGYDIDFADEVAVYLNGEPLGYLSPGPNNGLNTPSLWWLPAERQLEGDNRIELIQTTPGYVWGITRLGLYQPGNGDSSAFGNLTTLTDGDTSHATGFELHLPYDGIAHPQGLLLEFTGYDVDWGDEIGLDLDGASLLELPAGNNNTWSAPDHLVLPAAWLSDGDNVLLIRNRINSGYNWGLRLERLLALEAGLGQRLPGQAVADQRSDAVRYLIPALGADSLLSLGVYDIDFADEVELLQDGASLGYTARTANNAWSITPEQVVIPAGQRTVITLDNSYNPPNRYVWGVRIEGLE